MVQGNIGEDLRESSLKPTVFLKAKFQRGEISPETDLGMSAVISSPNILQIIDQHMFMQNFPDAEETFRRTRDWRALGWDGGISPARMGILM